MNMRFGLGALFLLTLAAANLGCASIAGVQATDADFLVKPLGDGTFSGWTDITIEQDVDSASSGTLTAVTLNTETPDGYPDLNYMGALAGAADVNGATTPLVSQDSFPVNQTYVIMNVLYHDDLRQFFPDGHTIRIDWTGRTNPSFTAWPTDGFWVHAKINVDIQ